MSSILSVAGKFEEKVAKIRKKKKINFENTEDLHQSSFNSSQKDEVAKLKFWLHIFEHTNCPLWGLY